MPEYIKKILGSGHNNNTTLIISNDEMNDIFKIVKSLEDSGILSKGVSETKLKNKEEICYLVKKVKKQLELVNEQIEVIMVSKGLP